MDRKVAELLRRHQPIQLSDEWFKARENAITASSAASLLIRDLKTCENYVKIYDLQNSFEYDNKCCNPYSSKNQYFLDKCRGSKFKGSVATYHGQKYESVVSDLYCNIKNTKVLEFGLLTHPDYSFIAASPDGITPEGVMLEIKAPYRRKITGIPPLYYYIQVQQQLAVCDLEICDFIEMEFIEFLTEQEWLDDETLNTKFNHQGLLIQAEKTNDLGICKLDENEYIYPPKELLDNTQELIKWKNYQLSELQKNIKPEVDIKLSVCYWKVGDKSITTIKRDREMFDHMLSVFKKEWNLITYYKKGDNWKKLIGNSSQVVDGKSVYFKNNCVLSDSEESEAEQANDI